MTTFRFNPLGAYRFFQLPYGEVKNKIVQMGDLIGNSANELQSQLSGVGALDQKIQLLQNFLIKRLEKATPDPIYDYCINRIADAKGLIR